MRSLILMAGFAACALVSCSSRAANEPSGSDATPPAAGVFAMSRLRIEADRGTLLAKVGGQPAVTVGEFNDRLFEFPIADTGQDAFSARREVLDQIIDNKVIVIEGLRRQGQAAQAPAPGGSPYQLDRAVAQSVIRESVANPMLVTDDEARLYVGEHRELIERRVGRPDASEEEKLLLAKFTMLSDRFQDEVKRWRSRETIEVFEAALRD